MQGEWRENWKKWPDELITLHRFLRDATQHYVIAKTRGDRLGHFVSENLYAIIVPDKFSIQKIQSDILEEKGRTENMKDHRRNRILFLRSVLTSLFFVASVSFFCTSIFAAEPYKHNPMDNPKAAADIVEDPDAVYGYAPSPESTRLKEYVEYDWTEKKNCQ